MVCKISMGYLSLNLNVEMFIALKLHKYFISVCKISEIDWNLLWFFYT